jgi:hypothetical protein
MALFELARSPWFWQVVLCTLIPLGATLAPGLRSITTLGWEWLWSLIGGAFAACGSLASRFFL